jgi:hypothetical protein
MDLERLNKVLGYDKLSMEEKIRRAVRAAKMEMHPVWIEAMRKQPIHAKMKSANEMFVFARRMLYFQEIEAGHSEKEARRIAAQRMLNGNDW